MPKEPSGYQNYTVGNSLSVPSTVYDLHSISMQSGTRSAIFEMRSTFRIMTNNLCFRQIQRIHIPSGVEVLCERCFENCGSLDRVTFESGSCLKRVEKNAFSRSGLKSIEIPSSVEVLCKRCFYKCESLKSAK